jgi:para-nitrobenzyl esterase
MPPPTPPPAPPLPTPDPDSRRRIAGGEIIGSREPNTTPAPHTTHAWRGLRYAAAPVGDLRWRAPQPPAAWSGTCEALRAGAMAPQIAGILAPVPLHEHGRIVGDEDCLYLNVFAPAWRPEEVPQGAERRAVMVWIHGGGNAVGTASGYDVARNLAAQDGVIVVTVNFRLGVLGWFTHPALQAAPGASDEERSGNFTLLDQLAALRWVRDNISAFGGDPGRVTIFGESAGGQNVLLLLASPLAAGLFHRAIAQSPVTETFSVDEAIHGLPSPLPSRQAGSLEITARLWAADGRSPDAIAARAALADRPAAEVAAFLRSRRPEQLIGAYTPGSAGIYLAPRPTRDGVTLPLAELPAVFASGAWNRVPVLLGSNRDEMRTFMVDKPEHSRLLFGKVPVLRDRRAYFAESDAKARAWRAVNVDLPADAMLAGGHRDVWTYRFDWDEAPRVPVIRPDLLLGAAHAMEMPFVFRDVAGEFDLFKVFTPFNRRGREAVAHAMGSAWTSFARTGQPALPGDTPWQRRGDAPTAESLVIDSPRDGGLRMQRAKETVEAIKQSLRASALPAALRCRVYARTFLWTPLFADHGSTAEYERWCRELHVESPAEAHRPKLEI